MTTELQDKIRAMIAERFDLPLEQLQPETTMESLGIDSLAVIEFMFEVEDAFKIRLADSREPLKTLSDVYVEIERAVSSADQSSGGGAV